LTNIAALRLTHNTDVTTRSYIDYLMPSDNITVLG